MTTVNFVTIRLSFKEGVGLRPAPHLLRGAIAARFPANHILHQHGGERVIYRTPRVLYRWDQEGPLVLGRAEAAHFLAEVDWPGMELRIGEQPLTVRDAICTFRSHEIRPSPRLVRYRFVSPWLPLSQENYQQYRSLNLDGQADKRDRLAVAGLLMGLRGVGIEFPIQLYAAFYMHSARQCRYKEVNLLGFKGRLVANVDLPDDFAIGRATSHGYGWLRRE
jgi:hypothetical protein